MFADPPPPGEGEASALLRPRRTVTLEFSPPHWRPAAPIRYHPPITSESQRRTRRIVMDAVTPKQTLADEHSHLVKPADMEWKPTRFPGCEVKTLMLDEKT